MTNKLKEIIEIWNRILIEIKKELNDDRIFETFLGDSSINKIEKDTLYVTVSSSLAKEVLSSPEYNNLIINVINKLLESNYKIEFLTKNETIEQIEEQILIEKEKPFANSKLRPDMNYANFVVGNTNKEAYQASLLMSSNKTHLFNPNPLFLYSDSGLGKTHLLNAIGNAILEDNCNKKVLITSGQDFFNEYIHIIKAKKQGEQLLDYFKDIDILLIDDIQFFVGKEGCQELFFNIFSYLINNDKKVVITSDKHPNDLQNLENRLVTRFTGGLTISILPPDKDTSVEIIRRHIINSGLDITRVDNDVIEFVADKFSKNVRELKGVINKLLFYSINVSKTDRITLENAMEAVGDYIKNNKNTKISVNRIIDVVSNYYSLTPSQVKGNIRTSQISLARHISMYLTRKLLNESYKQIGLDFGGKDHSTVLNAIKNVENSLKLNPSLQVVINNLIEKI